MEIIYSVVSNSAPLLLASFGALISEHTDRMALFLDGVINMSAFLCFYFTTAFNSSTAGALGAVGAVCVFVLFSSLLSEKIHANHLLVSLSLNIIAGGIVSVLSARLFHTRGVLTSPGFVFGAEKTRAVTTLLSVALVASGGAFLRFTKTGLYLRITGSDFDVLASRGIPPQRLRLLSQVAAALYGGSAGCILSARLSAFVPNIAGGTGWTALAVVFLGKKNTAAITAVALAFSAAQFCASNIQNIHGFSSAPSSLLLALPYLTALALIIAVPNKKTRGGV